TPHPTAMSIKLEYAYMLDGATRGALTQQVWNDAPRHFAESRAVFKRQRESGVLGFVDLAAEDVPGLNLLLRFVEGIEGGYDDVVVLGIGGSALGNIALRSALRSPNWNELDDTRRGGKPRLHVLENIDPTSVHELLDRVSLERTMFVVISKSGGTAETMAQYLIVRERLEHALGDRYHNHIVFVTDPKKGALRDLAKTEGTVTFDIPPNVGGRFSVLSPVGLFPLAAIGVDIRALLAGARDMIARCEDDDLSKNPAGTFALLQWLADTQLGCHNHIMMPYSDPLREFSAWWVQLWAESLGKVRPDGKSVGPTPIPALGVTDQHSQVQLFMEGPRDKTVTFIEVKKTPVDITIPKLHQDVTELAYLGGHTLKELLDVERRATAAAFAQRGKPSMTIHIDQVDAHHVGGMIMMLEYATIYAGALYGIDPLNQPGVELGKNFTYAQLNRPDAEAARKEWAAIKQPEAKFV
ncbi:MAG: glucose-6-phosphate isomerase, partial [Gemmatimonadota bacterium]|nr:glucose-6-phosphate isomerase [Gemmatimonadota bacterium]